MRKTPLIAFLLVLPYLLMPSWAFAESFVAFESVQFRPIALSPSGRHLFVVNTPDNRLEIFDLAGPLPRLVESVPVGLEPVAVAVRSPKEVWVVNHLSDSVSVVELGWPFRARVKRTLWVGDEPRDIVFAGEQNSLAFVSAAHRGQNTPYNSIDNPGELTTPGIGRTDVWVFDTNNTGSSAGGDPVTIETFFGDSPGPLARSADGNSVYVGVFKSGNGTTVLTEPLVCNGGAMASPCQPTPNESLAPGGIPAPNTDIHGVPAKESGLIVRNVDGKWLDELQRDWSSMVRFNLPDLDVFRMSIDTNGQIQKTGAYSGVGTVLFGMAVNPLTGKLFVANTEAFNDVRFGGARPDWFRNLSSVNGRLQKSRISIIDPVTATVESRHLNKHIDYSIVPSPAGVKERSLAIPQGIAFAPDGKTVFVAAMGSDAIGVFNPSELEDDTFVPGADAQIVVSGGGPTGLAVDAARQRLYVLTRYNNAVSVIDLGTKAEIASLPLPNPEPAAVRDGRRFLYDARLTSSNGEASCAACHIGGDKDELAWDLGDPLGAVVDNPNPFTFRPPPAPPATIHSMKGPMTTQTLRGLVNQGPMHWRGDKSGGFDEGGDPLDAAAAFRQFNAANVELQGLAEELSSAEMDLFTEFALRLTPPPNPIRNLDNSLSVMQASGREDYFSQPLNGFGARCATCHVLDTDSGFFGANGESVFAGAPNTLAQADFKTPQLRNMYEKVGMFGLPATVVTGPDDNGFTGDQIRGFGYMHDGGFDTVYRRLNVVIFDLPGGPEQLRNIEQFVMAYDSELKPVVGQQVTLTPDSGPDAHARADLLTSRALEGDADLVVRVRYWTKMQGWLLQPDGTFRGSSAGSGTVTAAQLRQLARWTGTELTFTAVPPGTGYRIALDRDEDGVLDGDE